MAGHVHHQGNDNATFNQIFLQNRFRLFELLLVKRL